MSHVLKCTPDTEQFHYAKVHGSPNFQHVILTSPIFTPVVWCGRTKKAAPISPKCPSPTPSSRCNHIFRSPHWNLVVSSWSCGLLAGNFQCHKIIYVKRWRARSVGRSWPKQVTSLWYWPTEPSSSHWCHCKQDWMKHDTIPDFTHINMLH